MMKIYNKSFFILFLVILWTEILIATVFKSTILRPVFGDFLVVILIYSFFRAMIKVNPLILGISVLILACLIEAGQFINIRDAMGLKKNFITDAFLGSSFDWWDILAYSLGVITILSVDLYFTERNNSVRFSRKNN